MKENCLDIGVIQAFLDSELSFPETDRVTSHIALCESCAVVLADAEAESAMVFSALDREFDSLVPTKRLWNKINESIRTEKENRSLLEKMLAFVRISLASPSMFAAASLLVVFGLFGALWINKSWPQIENAPTAAIRQMPAPISLASTTSNTVPETEIAGEKPFERNSPKIQRAIYRPETKRQNAAPKIDRNPVTADSLMPGEESYAKTILTLRKTVDEQKDGLLRPSERVAYERDMAVVNDTIAKMRSEVRRNPKNETARQMLYSSYQNKIDLLNSVAQKEELVASLK